jgi:hypothetical protein
LNGFSFLTGKAGAGILDGPPVLAVGYRVAVLYHMFRASFFELMKINKGVENGLSANS